MIKNIWKINFFFTRAQYRYLMMIPSQRFGFTLLELSIILVVIGLIIGGITVGKDLIRNAELNTVIADLEKHERAISTFKAKYDAPPGDLYNAIEYWGAAHVDPATCNATASTGSETCNGNGNGIIEESYRAWQHLANAGIITGQFTGVSDADGGTLPGENCPASIPNTGFEFSHDVEGRFIMHYGAYMQGDNVMNGALTPIEARELDLKIDDGVPNSGKIFGLDSDDALNRCVTIAGDEYQLDNNALECYLNIHDYM